MERKFSVTVAILLSYQLLEPGVPWNSVAYYFVVFFLMFSMNTCFEFWHDCSDNKIYSFQELNNN
jgi:hypothetical protein